MAAAACTTTKVTVSQSDLEYRVGATEAPHFASLKSVACDGDLKGKVGATQRCKLTATNGRVVGVTATVEHVKGTDVQFRIALDSQTPNGPTATGPSS